MPGVLLIVALYGAVGLAVVDASRKAAVLLGPAAIAFLAANLFDWPWHLAGAGMLWAIAVGGLIGARVRPPPAPGRSRKEAGRRKLRRPADATLGNGHGAGVA